MARKSLFLLITILTKTSHNQRQKHKQDAAHSNRQNILVLRGLRFVHGFILNDLDTHVQHERKCSIHNAFNNFMHYSVHEYMHILYMHTNVIIKASVLYTFIDICTCNIQTDINIVSTLSILSLNILSCILNTLLL